jgi:Leucine-rich repeat (LRR) protein
MLQLLAVWPDVVALPKLNRLVLDHNHLANLPQLHPLLQLPQLRHLSISSNPINKLVLLGPYLAYRCVCMGHGV